MKILVVDDSAIMRKMIVKHLEAVGYSDMVEASNGVEALRLMKDVDIVLTDWKMPFMNGLTLIKEIRQHTACNHVAIIFITAFTESNSVERALREGVDDYIVKPFSSETLASKVKRAEGIVLERRETLRASNSPVV